MPFLRKTLLAVSASAAALTGVALADSIDPSTFSATVPVGGSVTVRKTVTVEEGDPVDALLDVMFLFDTTGSMIDEIAAAEAAATDILNGLSAFGDLASGVGFYNDVPPAPGFDGVLSDLTTTDATTITAINSLSATGGGDFPELGNDAILDAASSASWRPGSNRFIIVLGDAPFKDLTTTDASVIAALAAEGIDLIGLDFSGGISFSDPGSNDDSFAEAIASLGGTSTTASAGTIVADILAGISTGFDTYSTVTVDDLGNGLPEFDVSTVCVSADTGACVGSDAVGTYDRSTTRTFEFDVTFTRIAGVDPVAFETYALVDGGIVAREFDEFAVPLPAAAWMFMAGLGGLAAVRRRKAA